MHVIFMRGCLPGNLEDEFAQAGPRCWHREDGEAVEDFHARAQLEAAEAGVEVLAFGGLPDPDLPPEDFGCVMKRSEGR